MLCVLSSLLCAGLLDESSLAHYMLDYAIGTYQCCVQICFCVAFAWDMQGCYYYAYLTRTGVLDLRLLLWASMCLLRYCLCDVCSTCTIVTVTCLLSSYKLSGVSTHMRTARCRFETAERPSASKAKERALSRQYTAARGVSTDETVEWGTMKDVAFAAREPLARLFAITGAGWKEGWREEGDVATPNMTAG